MGGSLQFNVTSTNPWTDILHYLVHSANPESLNKTNGTKVKTTKPFKNQRPGMTPKNYTRLSQYDLKIN